MSYDSVVEKVKSLPESCLEAASNYIEFLLFQNAQENMSQMFESDSVFESKMNQGLNDMKAGRVTPIKESYLKIKNRFN